MIVRSIRARHNRGICSYCMFFNNVYALCIRFGYAFVHFYIRLGYALRTQIPRGLPEMRSYLFIISRFKGFQSLCLSFIDRKILCRLKKMENPSTSTSSPTTSESSTYSIHDPPGYIKPSLQDMLLAHRHYS